MDWNAAGAIGEILGAVAVLMAFDQGLIDKALFRGVVRDVDVALGPWTNLRQAVERWFNNYPDFKDSQIF